MDKTLEERIIELDLRIRQQENLILNSMTSIVELATAVSNIASSVRLVSDTSAIKEATALVGDVLTRVKPLVEPDSGEGCRCGGACSASKDGD